MLSSFVTTMKIKRTLRLIILALMIGLACIVPLPVPIGLRRKDEKQKYLIEQIDTKDDEMEDEDIIELF